jgi:anti-sigma factor (TIGR02949 family)
MKSHTHDCRAMLADLNDYIDGDLPEDLCAELENHMRECENCRVVFDTMNKTIYLYQSCGREVEVPDGARDRLFSALKLDDFVGPGK